MPRPVEIRLPADQEVRWPQMCPGCGAAQIDDAFEIRRTRMSLLAFLFPLAHATASRRQWLVPMCSSCLPRERRRHRRFVFHAAILAIGAPLAVSPWLVRLQTDLEPLVLVGVCLTALAPYLWWTALHPSAVDVAFTGGTVCYCFARADYAAAFSAVNRPGC
jgi:hypothetical protein